MVITLGAILGLAKTITTCIAVAKLAIEGLKIVGKGIVALGKALGIIKPTIKPEELGEKAIQAEEAGIKPENPEFEGSYKKYLEAVERYDIDPTKIHSEEDCLTKAAAISACGIAEVAPELEITDIVKNVVKNPEGTFFTDDVLKTIGDGLNSGKLDPIVVNTISGVLNGTVKDSGTIDKAYNDMASILKTANPNLSDDAAKSKALSF